MNAVFRARIDRPAHAFRCARRNFRSLPKTLNPQMLMNGQTDEILSLKQTYAGLLVAEHGRITLLHEALDTLATSRAFTADGV
jgi:hypothetical protein